MLGLLLVTQGEPEEAMPHFDAALAFCRAAGYRPEYASAACDYANVLLDHSTDSGRAGGEDRAKANKLLDESLAISSELGRRPLMERVLSRREILEA